MPPDGRLAQLVERLVYTEDVGSSSLSPPTIFFNDLDDMIKNVRTVSRTVSGPGAP